MHACSLAAVFFLGSEGRSGLLSCLCLVLSECMGIHLVYSKEGEADSREESRVLSTCTL